mmetsp:Transcript_374/g.1710  ORF Transcript_374/g.1710 Transcript_374/m.1710 type:complete len:226 (+) Transcript_374:717-1394(+)
MYSRVSGSVAASVWKYFTAALNACHAPCSLAIRSTCPPMPFSGNRSSTAIAALSAATAFSLASGDPRSKSCTKNSTPPMARCLSPTAIVRSSLPVTCTVGASNTSVAITSALVLTRAGSLGPSICITNAAPSAAKKARRESGDVRSIADSANCDLTRLSIPTAPSSASLASRLSIPRLGSGGSIGRMDPCASSTSPALASRIFRALTSFRDDPVAALVSSSTSSP